MMDSFEQIRCQARLCVPVICILVLFVDFSCSSEFREKLFTAMLGCSEDVILPVTPVNSDVVKSQGQCLVNCLGDSSCMSVNLCDAPQSGQVCHRQPETSNGSCSDLQAAPGCVFLEPVNVCQHGGTYNDVVARCDCYDDFTGPYCERRYTHSLTHSKQIYDEVPNHAGLINKFGENQEPKVNVCQHGGTYNDVVARCDCYDDFTGPYCERRYRDCSEAYNGMQGRSSRFRTISIRPLNAPREYQVECYLGHGGWTVVENRASDCQNDYNKTWAEYKTGWTTPCNRWLGLEALHYITNQRRAQFSVVVRGTGSLDGHHYYKNLRIGDEASGYTLTYTGTRRHSSKTTGNGFEYGGASKHINGQRFATWDHPDSSGCAVSGGAGWWYGTDCPDTNLHKRFDTNASASNVAQWIDDMGLLEKVSDMKIKIKVLW